MVIITIMNMVIVTIMNSLLTRPVSRWSLRAKGHVIHTNYSYCSTGSNIIIIIDPLTARVVGAPQMILQPVLSVFPRSPLPYGTCRTPALSIPWCCLPTSSSVIYPLSLCLARWSWQDLMNGRLNHTTAVCVSLRSSDLRVVQLPAESWPGLPCW